MKTLMFESNGLKSSDMTPEEVRYALDIPEVVSKPVGYRGPAYHPFWKVSDSHQAIINNENGKLYGIHSDKYHLITHEEGILDVQRAIERNPEYGKVEWSCREFDDYKRFHAKGVFIDVPYEIKRGDIVNPTVEYTNSYDGAWPEGIFFGAFRVICSNGLTVGEQFFRDAARHIGEERRNILLDFEKALHGFSMQTDLWRGWVDRELAIANTDSLENIDLTKKVKGEIVEDVSDNPEMDLWTFYNIITAVITHKIASLNKRMYMWGRLQKETRNW